MVKSFSIILLVLFFLVSLLSFPKAEATEAFLTKVAKKPLAQGELLRLKKGEIIIMEEKKQAGQRMRYVLAKVWIDRSPDKVWKALRNQESLFKGDPYMKKVKVVKDIPPRTQNIAYTLSISRLFPAFNYITRVDYLKKSWLVQFVRISGSFKSFKGFAKLRPIAKGKETVMVYALQLDSGPLLPQFVVRSVIKSGLPDLMKNIRKRVHNQNPCIQALVEPCATK